MDINDINHRSKKEVSMELEVFLEECCSDKMQRMIFSNARDKMLGEKVKIRPVKKNGELYFQGETTRGTKVYHSNYKREELIAQAKDWLKNQFRQCEVDYEGYHGVVLVSKKGSVTVKKKRTGKAPVVTDFSHNRTKNYLLPEGEPVDFLVDLGVMTKEGKVVHAKYDKFRQINRFLEFIDDIVDELPKDKVVKIIDFGCGKSYLTFAMYYFLHEKKGLAVEITGLDLKEDVIARCNQLKDRYHYEGLQFLMGDIADYEGTNEVDMVVTLHACDTATDYALYKAVKWGAKVILSVPCCQHELNKQIENEPLSSVLKYGLLKERMSALLTDGIRGNLLEEQGYQVQVLEFIDMEHTPKNILLRCVYTGKKKEITNSTMEFLGADLTLARLLRSE